MHESVYDHSLRVSFDMYTIGKSLGLDYKSCAIGGLLHDFYDNPWQGKKKSPSFLKRHGFVHARQGLENARIYYPELMNPIVENIILRHMFPLNIIPPKYKETWLITLIDKVDSMDLVAHPFSLMKMLKRKKDKMK